MTVIRFDFFGTLVDYSADHTGQDPTRSHGLLRRFGGGLTCPAAAVACVGELAREHRLAVVTNTHQPDLVPNHLAAMGLAPLFDVVVTTALT